MLVSHGLDGVPSGDDVLVPISGFQITVPAISSARVRLAEQKEGLPFLVVVKGYNAGSDGTDAALLLNGDPAGTIQSWTPTEVVVGLDILPTGNQVATLRLSGGGMAMQELELVDEVEQEPIGVSEWIWYW